MVTDLILVCMVCVCNVCVIPRSVSRKDLGYKTNISLMIGRDIEHLKKIWERIAINMMLCPS